MITQIIILYFHKVKLIKNSKISFANAFLKQNASKLNEIQNANSQTLARSEVLNSTNTTNTSNNTN
ncbi:hypothetical protein FYT26_08350, partial [Campylobacter jejuni]|nr:hypothetical protein [Campylobacter jejuni]EDP5339380.1 hypothetical protein [Campylobacter jejuni]